MSAEVKTHDQRKKAHRSKGPWLNRVFIGMLTFCFGLLTFIFEGFVLRDIETIRQPDWETYRSQRSDQSLSELQVRSSELGRQLADLDRQIKRQEAEQRVLQDGSRNLQETMRQLVELQRLSIQKEVAMSEGDQVNLSTALNQFLETQTRYQSFNKQLQDQHETKRLAEDEKRSVDDQVQQATAPIRREYDQEIRQFRMRLALYQLLVLIPLLLASGTLLLKRPQSGYYPVFLAFGLATLFKCYLVVDRYFPARYVNYVLILLLLAVVGKLLMFSIGLVMSPGRKWLIKQYREAYERFLCPVCEYPIRTGPRRFLYWTRRTVHKTIPPQASSGQPLQDEPYSCPSCGTTLFEDCRQCGHSRHSLLPHCSHCGEGSEDEVVKHDLKYTET